MVQCSLNSFKCKAQSLLCSVIAQSAVAWEKGAQSANSECMNWLYMCDEGVKFMFISAETQGHVFQRKQQAVLSNGKSIMVLILDAAMATHWPWLKNKLYLKIVLTLISWKKAPQYEGVSASWMSQTRTQHSRWLLLCEYLAKVKLTSTVLQLVLECSLIYPIFTFKLSSGAHLLCRRWLKFNLNGAFTISKGLTTPSNVYMLKKVFFFLHRRVCSCSKVVRKT